MADKLEAKLAALSAINSALQKENDKLRRDLERSSAPETDAEEEIAALQDEMAQLQEEFTSRLNVAEQSIKVLKDEKVRLEQQLHSANAGGSASEARMTAMQDTINTLSAEGESLSRRNGELESNLRKLKSSSKDLEAERDKLSSRLKALESQLLDVQERLEKASQAGASQVEDLERELSAVRLDAKKQVAEARREATEALARVETEAARGGAEVAAAAREREAALLSSLSDMRATLRGREDEWGEREEGLRRAAARLEERIRMLEAEKADLAACSSDASQPLLKQIESMASASAASRAAAEEAERKLLSRLRMAEAAAGDAAARERAAGARAALAEAAASAAKEAASASAASAAELRSKLDACSRDAHALSAEKASAEERLSSALAREEAGRVAAAAAAREAAERLWDVEQRVRSLTTERDELLERLETLAHAHSPSNALNTTPHASSGSLTAKQPPPATANGDATHASTAHVDGTAHATGLGRSGSGLNGRISTGDGGGGAGVLDGVSSTSAWSGGGPGLSPGEEDELSQLLGAFMRGQAAARQGASDATSTSSSAAAAAANVSGVPIASGHGSGGGELAKVQRTLALLQARVAAAERAREHAGEQLFAAIRRADAAEAHAVACASLRTEAQEAQAKVELVLELLGERNERIEQLEEDIQEMKSIFHAQLEDAVNQLHAAKQEAVAAAQQQDQSHSTSHSTCFSTAHSTTRPSPSGHEHVHGAGRGHGTSGGHTNSVQSASLRSGHAAHADQGQGAESAPAVQEGSSAWDDMGDADGWGELSQPSHALHASRADHAAVQHASSHGGTVRSHARPSLGAVPLHKQVVKPE